MAIFCIVIFVIHVVFVVSFSFGAWESVATLLLRLITLLVPQSSDGLPFDSNEIVSCTIDIVGLALIIAAL